MIKKFILAIASFIFCACTVGQGGKAIDPSINLADRHIWIPKDDEDLEKRRLRQARFDGIAKEIETLFFMLETTVPRENIMRETTKDFIPKIKSLESNITEQITNEQKRIDTLDKELKTSRSINKNIKSQIVNMSLAPVFTKNEYANAFYYYRKGQFKKSALLFKHFLQLNPPRLLIDNILFGLSMSYFRGKNFAGATGPLSRIIAEHPNSDKWYMSHVMLALIHNKKGEKSQALYILEKGLKMTHRISSVL